LRSRYAIVEELAGFGATVHTCSRNEAELNKCLEQWKSVNIRVTGSVCDVSSRAQREKLMDGVRSIFQGKLNILVSLDCGAPTYINNAGAGIVKPAMDFTTEEYSFLMATNSSFHPSQLAQPLLKASEAGNIAFISSIVGVVGVGI
ncbi:tropinone reductase homolog At2g29170-like, partial [Elaeis guineensis]|uniref:tropinone reductase homolog At2g29170-like n=1 Tax=Elaeis guineensis var. tenera TaxID=51953 RepID=UPI003C6DA6EC